MARNNIVSDPELWISFVDARNETSHSYDEKVAQKVFAAIRLFLPEAKKLVSTLEKIK
jgi:nucleotidyltransferase substrate binding protein (TIGR01987 family)